MSNKGAYERLMAVAEQIGGKRVHTTEMALAELERVAAGQQSAELGKGISARTWLVVHRGRRESSRHMQADGLNVDISPHAELIAQRQRVLRQARTLPDLVKLERDYRRRGPADHRAEDPNERGE